MKKTYAIMASLMLLAACNGEEEIDETEETDDVETVEEDSAEEEVEDTVEEDEEDTEADADEDADTDDEEETDEEASDDDSALDNGDNQYAGNTYFLSIQHAGQLQPFGELVFEDDTVTLEQEDVTFEGTYTVDDKTLNYEVESDDVKFIVTLVQNDYEGEIVVEGHVESYEVESDDLTAEDEETIEELQGAIFMMTKND